MQEVVPGFEKAVLGMSVGQKKKTTFPPEDGYGQPKDSMIITIEAGTLPEGAKLDLGYVCVRVHLH
jgi:peptidylprolyl isomerase